MDFIIDSSVACNFLLEDENDDYANTVIRLLKNKKGLVPSLFYYEVTNVLYMAIKRKRCSQDRVEGMLSFLCKLSLVSYKIDNVKQMQSVLEIAIKHNITAYDASYLYLAEKFSLPLATLDNALIKLALKKNLYLTFS